MPIIAVCLANKKYKRFSMLYLLKLYLRSIEMTDFMFFTHLTQQEIPILFMHERHTIDMN